MLSSVPNLAFSFGYTNASWTLRSDLTARIFCRLLNHMERKGLAVCRPIPGSALKRLPFTTLTSGYIQRALPMLPSQGDRDPWRLRQNYVTDLAAMSFSRIAEGLQMDRAATAAAVRA